jgi:GMP synthase-like glutamine amidotransferase
MLNILIIQNGYCTTSINEYINNIITHNVKILIIKSYDTNINYNTIDFIKKWNRIIILGGYQSVRNLEIYPYLNNVIDFIKIGISLNIPILGICLGCQLIAKAYGNDIIKMDYGQFGYNYKLKITEDGLKDPIFNNCNNLDNILSFHMDTFNIKNDNPVKILAKKDLFPYIINVGSAYGVQFHPEVSIPVLKCYLEMKCDILFNKIKMDEILEYAIDNEQIILKNGTSIIKQWLL